MSYVDPHKVTSPKDHWKRGTVLYNKNGWSAAEGEWKEEETWEKVLAIRWNGTGKRKGKGQPQSRGYPTWFIVPEEIEGALRREIARLKKSQKNPV